MAAEEREALLRINGGEPLLLHLPAGSGGQPAEVELTVRLKRGRNTISLANDSAPMPEIDCLRLQRGG